MSDRQDQGGILAALFPFFGKRGHPWSISTFVVPCNLFTGIKVEFGSGARV
jgi:hypothetical protein